MLLLAAVLAVTSVAGPGPAQRPRFTPAPAPALPRVIATFEHDLSTPNGRVPLTWPSLALDRSRSESFVVGEGFVRIFNAAGMEIHRFGDDGALGYVNRVVVLDDGSMVVLASRNGRNVLLKCDFRGDLVAQMALTGVPEGFADLDPDQLVYRGGRIYLAERGKMRVVVTDENGTYRQAFSLRQLVAAAVGPDSDVRPGSSMDGFGVDSSGNLLFTMSTMFQAGRVTPSGELKMFGSRGSMPGRFNNVGGIDGDEEGNIYVTDRLRSVVSVWSPDLKNLGEFGYRGYDTSNLITPYEIAVGNGRVFVAQAAQRGVRVFRVQIQKPPEPPKPPPVVARPPPRPPPVKPAALTVPEPEPAPPPKKYTLVEVTRERIEIKQQVKFATAKYKVLPASFKLLDQVAQVLRDFPRMRVSVEGHTDNVGGEAFNLKLSQRRAEAVRDYLVTKGISPERLEAVGWGPTKPIAINKTGKGKAQNRRTEFRIVAQE